MARPIPSPEQCIALVSFDDRPDADFFNAAFGLLYGCGIFIHEMLAIRRRDVTLTDRMRLAITGSRERLLPLPKGAADRLQLLMDRRAGRPDDELVFFRGRAPVHGWTLNRELGERSMSVGLDRPLTMSDLRLAFARHMADGQTPFEVISGMMGYSERNTLHEMLAKAAS